LYKIPENVVAKEESVIEAKSVEGSLNKAGKETG
jgi:hypothetical protein